MVNAQNKFQYVYLKKVATQQEAQVWVQSQMNGQYHDKLWVLSVNNSNETITDNDH
jgi:DNA repair protein RadC